jgi:alkylhydroperoxidase/carboxymuconolactone decarboxylase family protein YurZ
MEKQMVERLQISIEEAKSIFSSMPRANDKSQERYTLGDFREDFPDIKKIVEKLHDVWTRSIPFEAK